VNLNTRKRCIEEISKLLEVDKLVCLDVEFDKGAEIMRVFVDRPGGIDIEGCVKVSRRIDNLGSPALQELREFWGLEVSSPGGGRIAASDDLVPRLGNSFSIEAHDENLAVVGGQCVLRKLNDDAMVVEQEGVLKTVPFKYVARFVSAKDC
jgi:ribosome maturation factor RimP